MTNNVRAIPVVLLLAAPFATAATAEQADDSAETRYARALMSAVEENWSPPEDMDGDESCIVEVRQDRSGYVDRLQVLECSSGAASHSALRAILATAPLPKPDEADAFRRTVRFSFTPE